MKVFGKTVFPLPPEKANSYERNMSEGEDHELYEN